MYGCIDNFIAFGADTIKMNQEYKTMLIDMYDKVMTSAELGAEDRNTACKLGEALLLHLRGHIDEVSVLFFSLLISRLLINNRCV